MVKRNRARREAHLPQYGPQPPALLEQAAATEHAFDAACSALVMDCFHEEFATLRAEPDPYGAEGRMCVPASPAFRSAAPLPARGRGPAPLASGTMLPEWPPGTVTILTTQGDAPHAIPVSAALRAGPQRVLLALAVGRASLARLRADPAVALVILSAGDVAITARGSARVLAENLVDGVVAVEITVERVQSHRRDAFVIESGVVWRWTDPAAAERDGEVRAALARLAQGEPPRWGDRGAGGRLG